MIFSITKHMYERVLLGDKTLTTRVRPPAYLRKGATWAIVPQRAKPAWWFGAFGFVGVRFDGSHFGDYVVVTDPRTALAERGLIWSAIGDKGELQARGFVQAAIVIDDFWTCPLQVMTDAEAEQDCGVVGATVADYMLLWDSINGRTKGARWQDNPTVTRIEFHVVEPVARAVARIGRTAVLDAAEAYRKPMQKVEVDR